jgi:glycosyltransferase involved in cell wall biosynthesis
LKVLFDHQIFTAQKIGGISRYFYELMKHSNGLFEYDVSGLFSENEYTKQLELYKEFPIKKQFKGKWRIYNYLKKLNVLNSKIKIKRKNYDIIHPTYYDPYVLKSIKNFPIIAESHDNIYKKIWQYNKNNVITTVKNHETKENISYRDEEIHVKNRQNSKKQNYILFTGAREGYKNFDRFIEAVAPLLIRYDFQLICTGHPFNNDEAKILNQYKIHDRTICKFVPENELQDIYAKAALFVFPSLYEGFGFPILEAFSSGCPIVLSNASCFPEIAKDAAVYFDPYSVEDMRQVIEKVLFDSSLQSVLVEKGYERVKYFSWEETAKQTYKLYWEVLSTPPPPPTHEVRLVITVYDMVSELFLPLWHFDKTIINKYLMIHNADKIIAISNNTKIDILKFYPEIDETKIEVIYLGPSFNAGGRIS